MQDLFNRIISYHDLINGDLAPDKINPASLANYLKSEQLPCKDMIVGRYKGFKLIDTIKVSSANPLAKKYFSISNPIPYYLYYKSKSDQLVSQLTNLRFDKLTLNYVPHYTTPVMLPVVSDWTKIENDRLRYCHIYHLLNTMEIDHINEIRHISLLNDDQESKAKISKLHRLLNSYLIEIANKYNFRSSKELELKIKKDYSIKDCTVLIYRSIVKILDFTYKSFYQYMDFNLKIPFSSELINNTNFLSKTNRLEKKLNSIDLEENLLNILNGELQKIVRFQSLKSITYQEYQYYTIFFNSLTNFFLKKENRELSQDKIVDFLIFINYKNESFFEYIIAQINSAANDRDDIFDKHEYLENKKKEYAQLDIKTSLYSLDDEHQLVRNLLKWIEIELSHLGPIQTPIASQKKEIKKLSINISLYVLVIFYRLLFDCGLLNIKKKTDLVQWIRETHTNKNNIDFSTTSITNKMSNPKSPHLEKTGKILTKLLDRLKLL